MVLDDLTVALQEGRIGGAGLDVYQIEPLPEGHPIWRLPNVLLTPHVAGDGPYLDQRRTELFIDNCKRFDAGEPLRNVVDKPSGSRALLVAREQPGCCSKDGTGAYPAL